MTELRIKEEELIKLYQKYGVNNRKDLCNAISQRSLDQEYETFKQKYYQ